MIDLLDAEKHAKKRSGQKQGYEYYIARKKVVYKIHQISTVGQ